MTSLAIAAIRIATEAPGPGPVRNVGLWSHGPGCKPLDECLCGLSRFRAALDLLIRTVGVEDVAGGAESTEVSAPKPTTFTVWLPRYAGGTAHRRQDCPLLEMESYPDRPLRSVLARPDLVSSGFVTMPDLQHQNYPSRSVKLCWRCGGDVV